MSFVDQLEEAMEIPGGTQVPQLEAGDEKILDFLSTPEGRKKAANALFSVTHKDFKGKSSDGTRSVTTMGRSGGTENWPVDGASADDLLYLLKKSGKALAKLGLAEELVPNADSMFGALYIEMCGKAQAHDEEEPDEEDDDEDSEEDDDEDEDDG